MRRDDEPFKLILVQNYFSKYDFKINKEEISSKVKLVWFSQNIDFNRGLEQIIPILEKNKIYVFNDRNHFDLDSTVGNIKKRLYSRQNT